MNIYARLRIIMQQMISHTYTPLSTLSDSLRCLPLPKVSTIYFLKRRKATPPSGFSGARDLVTPSPKLSNHIEKRVFKKSERLEIKDGILYHFDGKIIKNKINIENPNDALQFKFKFRGMNVIADSSLKDNEYYFVDSEGRII